MKSVLVDFLVGAGIKPTAIVSYNHLGNNDGMNLSAPQTFRSKEISKSNVVDDMVRGTPCVAVAGMLFAAPSPSAQSSAEREDGHRTDLLSSCPYRASSPRHDLIARRRWRATCVGS